MTVDIVALQQRVKQLEEAIRKHMNTRGDDRCYLDDAELYSVLPEGDTRPSREVAVTLENCVKFIECRQEGREYVSPQRRIEELEKELALLKGHIKTLCNELNWRKSYPY